MVNREIIRRKLEKLEGNLTKTDFILKRNGNLDEFLQVTNEMRELVKELKAYIEYEPRSANEMNPNIR